MHRMMYPLFDLIRYCLWSKMWRNVVLNCLVSLRFDDP